MLASNSLIGRLCELQRSVCSWDDFKLKYDIICFPFPCSSHTHTHTLFFLILFLTSINHHFSPTFTEHVHTSISQFRLVEITVTAKWWIRFYLNRVWKIPRLHFYYSFLSWSESLLLMTDHGMTSLTSTWYPPLFPSFLVKCYGECGIQAA
jgi:hypothetical protein